MSNASTAATGMRKERPPVLGSTLLSWGMVSRITPSLVGVLSSPLVVAPVVVLAAPVVSAVVVPVGAPVVAVVSAVPVVLVPSVDPHRRRSWGYPPPWSCLWLL